MFKNEQLYVPYRCLRYFYIRSEKPPEASYLQERRCRIFTEISYANQGPPSRLGKETTCVIPPTHFCSNSRFSQKYRKDAKLCIPRSWDSKYKKEKLTTSEDEIGMMNEFAEIQDALFLRREKTKRGEAEKTESCCISFVVTVPISRLFGLHPNILLSSECSLRPSVRPTRCGLTSRFCSYS